MAEARKTTVAKAEDAKPAGATAKSTNNFPWKIIIGVIVAAVIIAGIVFCIIQLTGKKDEGDQKVEDDTSATTDATLKTGKGKELEAKYASLDGYDYKLLVPSDFTAMSTAQIAEDYGESDAPDLVLTNKENTVNLALSKPENSLSDDQIQEYLDTVEAIFELSADVVSSNVREINGHKVGEIKLVTDYTDEEIYNHMAFFSYNGKLAIISFNCLDSMRDEWGKVGEEILNSLIINQ